jgi:release factor glutamine methyltransferase
MTVDVPIDHTTQTCEFGPLRVRYDDRVLAPRPWTLLQSRHAAAWLAHGPPGPIIELHCGAGHIGQAAALWSGRELVQVDDDPASCTWARRNADDNGVTSDVRCQPLEALRYGDGPFALVLADPPYVPSAETIRFRDDPRHAIDGGSDGLDGFRACVPRAANLTSPRGAVVLQVRGPRQASAVTDLVHRSVPELRVQATVTVSCDQALVALVRR